MQSWYYECVTFCHSEWVGSLGATLAEFWPLSNMWWYFRSTYWIQEHSCNLPVVYDICVGCRIECTLDMTERQRQKEDDERVHGTRCRQYAYASSLLYSYKWSDHSQCYRKRNYVHVDVLLTAIFYLNKQPRNLSLGLSSLTGTTRTAVVVARSESSNRSSNLNTGKVLKVDSLEQSLWWNRRALGSCVV